MDLLKVLAGRFVADDIPANLVFWDQWEELPGEHRPLIVVVISNRKISNLFQIPNYSAH